MTNPCPRCIKRGKTWNGDDPVCAFESGVFSKTNWNCATMNELRDLINPQRNSDFNSVVLSGPEDSCAFVVLYWYKSRGRVESAGIWDGQDWLQPLTLEAAESVLHPGRQWAGPA